MIKTLILSCKKATELVEKRSIVSLSFKETVLLHVHTAICDACATYQKQSVVIDDMLKQSLHHDRLYNYPQQNDHLNLLIDTIIEKIKK